MFFSHIILNGGESGSPSKCKEYSTKREEKIAEAMSLEWNRFCIVQTIHDHLGKDEDTGKSCCKEGTNANYPKTKTRGQKYKQNANGTNLNCKVNFEPDIALPKIFGRSKPHWYS